MSLCAVHSSKNLVICFFCPRGTTSPEHLEILTQEQIAQFDIKNIFSQGNIPLELIRDALSDESVQMFLSLLPSSAQAQAQAGLYYQLNPATQPSTTHPPRKV